MVGLLTGLFARHHGADEVVVLDPTPLRRAAAEGLGLTALDPDRGDVAVALKSRWRRGAGDRGADVVFQCRGRSAALALALRLLRPQGAVIDLAFYTDDGSARCGWARSSTTTGSAVRTAQIGRVPRGTGARLGPRAAVGGDDRAAAGARRRGARARRHRRGPARRGPGAARRPRGPPPARHPGGADLRERRVIASRVT